MGWLVTSVLDWMWSACARVWRENRLCRVLLALAGREHAVCTVFYI